MSTEKELYYGAPSMTLANTSIPAGGTPSILIEWTVPLQAMWYVPQNIKLLANIYDASGNQSSTEAYFLLAYSKPLQSLPKQMGSEQMYGFYSTHTVQEQSNSNYLAHVVMNLDTPNSFKQATRVQLLFWSPAAFTVSWTGTYVSKIHLQKITEMDAAG